MKNDNTQPNHRGSSPPFQDPERDFYDWMKELVSIDMRGETASANQISRRPGNGMTLSTDPNNGGSREGGDDDSRRRDDAGKAGEAV